MALPQGDAALLQTGHIQWLCLCILALVCIQCRQTIQQAEVIWIVVPGRVGCFDDPCPHALEDHGVDFAHSDFAPHDLEDALSVFRLEALALRHVDGGQHIVNRSSGVRCDIFQEGFSAALGHGHLEPALRDDGAVYLEQAPAALQGDRIVPRSQNHHRAAEVSDGRLEGGAPPGEVQLHLHMLVHAGHVEPDDDVGLGLEVGQQRGQHIQEHVLPGMRDEHRRHAHRGMARLLLI